MVNQRHIYQVISPVTICLLYVVSLVRILEWNIYRRPNVFNRALSRIGISTTEQSSVPQELLHNFIIVVAFLALILLVTLVILFVFYMNWQSCLTYYFYLPSLIIMSVLTPSYLRELFLTFDCPTIDIMTIILFTWNFTCLGMMAIFGIYAPTSLSVQQFYLIHNSAMLAVLIIYALPSWTSWMLLGFLVIWDLFAVLAPIGPLRIIMTLADKSGIVDMPGLVYSTDGSSKGDQQERPDDQYINDTDQEENNDNNEIGTSDKNKVIKKTNIHDTVEIENSKTTKSKSRSSNQPSIASSDSSSVDHDERGLNIGLGDFIFYSLLIGITAKGRYDVDFYTILSTGVAIVMGLILTLSLLIIRRRAIPALPISIALGLFVSFFSSRETMRFASKLSRNQIFV